MPRDPGQTQRLIRRLQWAELDLAWLQRLAEMAKAEDLEGAGLLSPPARPGDPSAALLVADGQRATARFVARGDCVVAGLGLLEIILGVFSSASQVRCLVTDGTAVTAGTVLAEIQGPAADLLTAERTLLNFLQRLTGVATRTHAHVQALGTSTTCLLDTRKTTPGFRALEKYAVGQGGGFNHRLGLFDRIMVKDNHLAAGQATTAARLMAWVQRARAARPDLLVEVEVDTLEQLAPVLAAGADIILLDNFTLPQLRMALPLLRGRAWSEVSGGVSLATLPQIGELNPDFVSCGGLTHAAAWADIGLDWA